MRGMFSRNKEETYNGPVLTLPNETENFEDLYRYIS